MFGTAGFGEIGFGEFDGPTAYLLSVEAGAFNLTGQDVAFLVDYVLPAETGVFTLTGQSVGLKRDLSLSVGAGTFTLTGQDIDLRSLILFIGKTSAETTAFVGKTSQTSL